MRFWLILRAVALLSLGAVALLGYSGLPYSPLSSIGTGNPYPPPAVRVVGKVALQCRDNPRGTEIDLFHEGGPPIHQPDLAEWLFLL